MFPVLVSALLAVDGGTSLPDLPAPLGNLDGVLEVPASGLGTGEKAVEVKLKGCARKVPVNVTNFAAGSMLAWQQVGAWLASAPGLEAALFPEGTLRDVAGRISSATVSDQKACRPLPAQLATAPALCPGLAADQAWLLAADGKPAAAIRWSVTAGKDKCLPRVVGVLFDSKQVARFKYDADFGGEASAALLGDKCQVAFTLDSSKRVFHAAKRGCKGR